MRVKPRTPKPTTTAHCAIALPLSTMVAYVVYANPLVVPAKAGTSHPDLITTVYERNERK